MLIYLRLLTFFFVLCVSCACASAKSDSEQVSPAAGDLIQHLQQLTKIRAAAQEAYEKRICENTVRQGEHKNRVLQYGDARMKFHWEQKGEAPNDGFPLFIALHGGGDAPASVNDGQFEEMKSYYLGNVDCGIYLVPRGVADTYNLHSVEESYPLYDRLIENMVVFAKVNPQRVYVMGFSAGGDGVYQIAARMADKFAAAAMSAGHPNGVKPTNFEHLPFLLQVGEYDINYDRHLETVRFFHQLCELHEKSSGGYVLKTVENSNLRNPAAQRGCDIVEGEASSPTRLGYVAEAFVHKWRGHNFLDNHPSEVPQLVYRNPQGWLTGADKNVHQVNTSSIAWLTKYSRDPYPQHLIWDLTTRAPSRGAAADYFYYLHQTPNTCGDEVEVRIVAAENKIMVEKLVGEIEILLNEEMLDLTQPLHIEFPDGATKIISASALEEKLAAQLAQAENFYKIPQHLPFLLMLHIAPPDVK